MILFSVFGAPDIPSGRPTAALNATRGPSLLGSLRSAYLPHFRRGLRAELGLFIVVTPGLPLPLRKNILEADTSACGHVCIVITNLFC